MNSINKLLIAVACALPLVAGAQTSTTPSGMDKAPSPNIKPADTPRSDLEKDQTTKTGQATKYGSPATDTGSGTMSKDDMNKMKGKPAKKGETATGDVPTYPAPAKDGTPTK